MSDKLSLSGLNQLNPAEFHETFRNVIESWPEGATRIAQLLPFTSVNHLVEAFDAYLDGIETSAKRKILHLHPDLAGKLAEEKKLTDDSASEQASVGLDRLEAPQKLKLLQMNELYAKKFGFPFVICVRECNRFDGILERVLARLNHSPELELNISIDEVKRICRLRIADIVNLNDTSTY